MKRTPLLFLVPLIAVAPLFAQDDSQAQGSSQEVLQNSTFSDGTTYWHGDVKPAGSDMTTDYVTSGAGASGIMVELHSSSWTSVTQELRDKAARGTVKLTITYQVSSDFKLSDHAEDYGNCGPQVGFGGANVSSQPGKIIAFLDVPPVSRSSVSNTAQGNTLVTIYNDMVNAAAFVPVTDQSPQTFTVQMFAPPPTQDSHQTLCLAFPPGNGTFTITKISMVPSQGGGGSPYPMHRQPGMPPGFPGGQPNPVPSPNQ